MLKPTIEIIIAVILGGLAIWSILSDYWQAEKCKATARKITKSMREEMEKREKAFYLADAYLEIINSETRSMLAKEAI